MENKNHIQILLKNNIVIAELVFEDNDDLIMADTFEKFDYDQIIDTRRKEVPLGGLGALWNGTKFISKPHSSWTLSDKLTWEPPIPKPKGDYIWSEKTQKWVIADELNETCNNC